ncbi:MAG: hypothetical protein HY904_06440 [Deltaproteobacteria bacterium]|nr:hypothetical protein [Deltaproteobacteria bacterium]
MVVTVVGITASLGVAQWRGAKDTAEARAAAKTAASLVTTARMLAQSRRSFVKVNAVTTGRGSIVLQECHKAFGDYSTGGCTYTDLDQTRMTMGADDYSTLTLQNVSGGPIVFTPLGLGDSSNADMVLSFVSRGGNNSRTTVSAQGLAIAN